MPRYVNTLIFIGFAAIWLHSCSKEYSCENCNTLNQPPVAIAGADQELRLPLDTAILDGSRSFDPDGNLISWKWRKVSGPVAFIQNPDDPGTIIKSLTTGDYQFELTVKDNGGVTAKDSVMIRVTRPSAGSMPPVASAGADQIITAQTSFSLNGSSSYDPDGFVSTYQWRKLEGPAQIIIQNPQSSITPVINVVAGEYSFELTVTDNDGLTGSDTLMVSVQVAPSCNTNGRQVVQAQLVPIGSLSIARINISVISAGNRIIIAGGHDAQNTYSRVDIYNIQTNSWTIGELSQARQEFSKATAGSKVVFAGGRSGSILSSRVDIYDIQTNQWTVADLSEPRSAISSAGLDDRIFFAGGWKINNTLPSSRVDIYNINTNNWSTVSLSQARTYMNATTAGGKIYFTGGYNGISVMDRIDIYDSYTNSWSQSQLSEPRMSFAGLATWNNIFWAGGIQPNSSFNGNLSDKVESRSLSTGISHFGCLSYPRSHFDAVKRYEQIVYFFGWNTVSDQFDIYDPVVNTWKIGKLPMVLNGAAIVSVNSQLFVVSENKLFKLEW